MAVSGFLSRGALALLVVVALAGASEGATATSPGVPSGLALVVTRDGSLWAIEGRDRPVILRNQAYEPSTSLRERIAYAKEDESGVRRVCAGSLTRARKIRGEKCPFVGMNGSISGDGRFLAYVDDESFLVRIANLATYNVRAVRGLPLLTSASIDWARGDRRLAVSSLAHGVYIVDVATGRVAARVRVPRGMTSSGISWRPGANELAVAMINSVGDTSIRVVNLRGDMRFEVPNDRASDSQPAWSPNGRYLAFSRTISEGLIATQARLLEIYVFDTRLKTLTRITRNRVPDSSPAWTIAE
jgi:hypothetical protein